jgi:hypothetical protein
MAAIMPDIKAATYRQCQNNGSCVNGMHSYKAPYPATALQVCRHICLQSGFPYFYEKL